MSTNFTKNEEHMNKILKEDLDYILIKLSDDERKSFANSNILITGCAGFLGFSFMHFFLEFAERLSIKKVIGLDTFILGKPGWIGELQQKYPSILSVLNFDISKDDLQNIPGAEDINFVVHGASIASPIFYRKYPIVTIDANIWGLRRLLEFYRRDCLRGFLFFSSSEIYGDPSPENIPTPEEYRGNVSCIGPRACYDESKRFGETICYLFAKEYSMPITVARPFNNFGPGMKIDDRRVPADFAKCIISNRSIEILSSGSPTRTFCYVSDAITGYLKCLVYGKFDSFNIGIETPEISVLELANIYQKIGNKYLSYSKNVVFGKSDDQEYLTHNPNRRCPMINKAKNLLGYNPEIDVYKGVERFLLFLRAEKERELKI